MKVESDVVMVRGVRILACSDSLIGEVDFTASNLHILWNRSRSSTKCKKDGRMVREQE